MCTCSCTVGKNQVSFSVTIGNEELMHECFPEQLRMGTARMKYNREREEDKKRCVSMESKGGTKNEVPIFSRIGSGLSSPEVAAGRNSR